MSNTVNPNPNPNPNQGESTGTNGIVQQPAKENILVSGFKRVKHAVTEGWKEVKNHPVTHGICAALGITAGGYVAYKLSTLNQPAVPDAEPPMAPVPLPEPEVEEDNPNPVEYVDVPQVPTPSESE